MSIGTVNIGYGESEFDLLHHKIFPDAVSDRINWVRFPDTQSGLATFGNDETDFFMTSFCGDQRENSWKSEFMFTLQSNLTILARWTKKSSYFLVSPTTNDISNLSTVYIGALGLERCRKYLINLGVAIRPITNYTEFLSKIISSQQGNSSDHMGIICEEELAIKYRMKIVAKDVQDDLGFYHCILIGRNSLNSNRKHFLSELILAIDNTEKHNLSIRKIILFFSMNAQEHELNEIPQISLDKDVIEMNLNVIEFNKAIHNINFFENLKEDFLGKRFMILEMTHNGIYSTCDKLYRIQSSNVCYKLLSETHYLTNCSGDPKIIIIKEFDFYGTTKKINFLDRNKSMPLKLPASDFPRLNIGLIGLGNFGQFLSKTFIKYHNLFATTKSDDNLSVFPYCYTENFTLIENFNLDRLLSFDLDVLLISTSIESFETVINSLDKNRLSDLSILLVDVLSVKSFPKKILLDKIPSNCDILCMHPMFGPRTAANSWSGKRCFYCLVRINNMKRCQSFLNTFIREGCIMVEMTCEDHDKFAAKTQFITHLVGRILALLKLEKTPIDTESYNSLLELTNIISKNSNDLFYGLYRRNPWGTKELSKFMRCAKQVCKELMLITIHDQEK